MHYGWHSYCRGCGIEMIKEDGGDWIVVDRPEVSAELSPEPAGGAVAYQTGTGAEPSRIARLFRRKR